MIPLLILVLLVSPVFSSSSSHGDDPVDDGIGHWKVIDPKTGQPCIMMNAKIELRVEYIDDESDATVTADPLFVPANATVDGSSCFEQVDVGTGIIDSQVLQLNFPDNAGWNVRLAFSQEPRLAIDNGDWALYMVTITADYSTMPGFHATHTHTYTQVVDFTDPPEISNIEFTRVGDSLKCPKSPQAYIINNDANNGPMAVVTFSTFQIQAYMTGMDDFGDPDICADDQNEIDLVPVIVSAVLAALVLFTLIVYFVYRSRLPTDILDMTDPEFEEEEGHHHQKEHSNLNGHDKSHQDVSHHDNYGYYGEEDHDDRF